MKFFDTLRVYRNLHKQLWTCINIQNEIRESYCLKVGDGMPQPKNMPADEKTVNLIARLNKLAQEQKGYEFSIECIRNDLDKFLEKLDFRVMQVIQFRLISSDRFRWKEIADKLMYSESSVKKFYRQGIEKLGGIEL